MTNFNITSKVEKFQDSISLDLQLFKKPNILSKSVNALTNQINSRITNNLNNVFLTGSNSNNTLQGFLVERSYENASLQGTDYFIVMNDSESYKESFSLNILDDTENSQKRNIKSISDILTTGKSTSFRYDISYFEIPPEEIIKNKTLLVDFLLRQFYLNQGFNYSLTKMEKIVDSIYNLKSFDNSLEIDFYKALTRSESTTDLINFSFSKEKTNVQTSIRTFYENNKLLFEYSLQNISDSNLSIAQRKLYKIDKYSNLRSLVNEKTYAKFEAKVLKQENKYYGSLLNRKIAESYSFNEDLNYEIEIKFDIYDKSKLVKIKSETRTIRL